MDGYICYIKIFNLNSNLSITISLSLDLNIDTKKREMCWDNNSK